MRSMIAPYRPAYPSFELIDNDKWLISMVIPTNHQATIISENLPISLTFVGNSYHRIQFELKVKIDGVTRIFTDSLAYYGMLA
jgi:hypothetical protein